MSFAKTSLLVIDVQRGILAIPGMARKKEIDCAFDQTVTRIAHLIDSARAASLPVLFVQHDGGPGHRVEAGTPGWMLREEIVPQSGEPVFHKQACDAFFETPLHAKLKSAGIEQLVICGCMTQYCVDTSVRRAVSLGYDVILVSDGHTTADTHTLPFEQIVNHHNALLDGFDAGERQVRVTPCYKLVEQLSL